MKQSAIDLGCDVSDLTSDENKVVISRDHPDARKYLKLPFFFDIVSYGSNFLAIHNVNSLYNGEYPTKYGQQSDYKYQPLTNTHEGILCLLEAIEVLGLTKEDKENIFYNNAYRLFKG